MTFLHYDLESELSDAPFGNVIGYRMLAQVVVISILNYGGRFFFLLTFSGVLWGKAML